MEDRPFLCCNIEFFSPIFLFIDEPSRRNRSTATHPVPTNSPPHLWVRGFCSSCLVARSSLAEGVCCQPQQRSFRLLHHHRTDHHGASPAGVPVHEHQQHRGCQHAPEPVHSPEPHHPASTPPGEAEEDRRHPAGRRRPRRSRIPPCPAIIVDRRPQQRHRPTDEFLAQEETPAECPKSWRWWCCYRRRSRLRGEQTRRSPSSSEHDDACPVISQ